MVTQSVPEIVKSVPLRAVVDPVAVKVLVKVIGKIVEPIQQRDSSYAFCSYTKPLEGVEKSLGTVYIFSESIEPLTYFRLLKCANVEFRLVKFSDLDNEGKYTVLKRLYRCYVTDSLKVLKRYSKYLEDDEVNKLRGELLYHAFIIYSNMRDIGIPRSRIKKECMGSEVDVALDKLYTLSRQRPEVAEEIIGKLKSGEITSFREIGRRVKSYA